MICRDYRNLLYKGRDVKLDIRLGLMIPGGGFSCLIAVEIGMYVEYDSSIYSCFVTHTPRSHLIKTRTIHMHAYDRNYRLGLLNKNRGIFTFQDSPSISATNKQKLIRIELLLV